MVPSEAQIVIIGGGVLGTSAAFQLAASEVKRRLQARATMIRRGCAI
jgi:glycine/D-amino acid oxidase-like deaminating enzyme